MVPKEVLTSSQAFRNLSDSELNRVLALCSERIYEPGAIVFDGGDSARELFIVGEGKVALQKESPARVPPGKQITVDIVTRGDVFGWSSVVEPYVYTLKAISLQKTATLVIDGVGLRAMLQEDRDMAYKVLSGLIKVVASRLSDTMHLLVSERSAVMDTALLNLDPRERATSRTGHSGH